MDIAAERAYPTPLSNSPLLPLLLTVLATEKRTPDTTNIFKNEYDYIVVGGGSAGSVVASRLSEYPCVSVLLLEAGHIPPRLTDVPALGRYFYGTDVDWQYISTPQQNCGFGYPNNQLPWSSGKMLGGSSSINDMMYVRANRKNYDDWECQGATGWSFNDVYPYFLKLEDNRDPEFLSNGYHTFGGPITVNKPRYSTELKEAIEEAALNMGYPLLDSNAERQTGFYDFQSNIRNSQRCGTAKAYLVPAENRTNLDIVTNAYVTKVVVENVVATGVEFDHLGQSYRVKAKREVIVSAGSLRSPQILKLSGIGPREELNRFNIPVAADVPGVGENFQNHGGVFSYFLLNPSTPDFDEKLANPENIMEYIENRTGPLASTDGYVTMAFLKGLQIRPVEDYPNYELYIEETAISYIQKYGLKEEVYQQIFGPYENRTIFSCSIQELHPYSVGTVKLQSTDPYIQPLLDPNFLADPRDVEPMVEGLKSCKRLCESDALKRIGVTPFETLIPGCEEYYGDDDEYYRCTLKVLFAVFLHPAGSCKMGNPLDPMTVVDPELRVKNVKNLRVVDASVMPSVVSGNTNIPTIMIAEKASDIIKKTINCFESRCYENIFQPSSDQKSFTSWPLDKFQFSSTKA